MKVLDFWEAPATSSDEKQCAAIMALTYAKGPTLDNLIKHGGAVSICFGRVVMAQLVDALAYCHGRCVLHRDIKPDNVIVSGASAKQDEIWEDNKNDNSPDWNALLSKWRVTLIDFGFARALGPADLEREKVTIKPSLGRDLQCSRMNLDKSVSHALKRNMSALGNKLFAAPEIVNCVKDNVSETFKDTSTTNADGEEGAVDITKTLSPFVSNYGMLADAYSLGNTLRYMMTGVPPNENANEIIRNQNNPIAKFFQWLSAHGCASTQSTGAAAAGLESRKYKYRAMKDLPPELADLLRKISHPSVSQRLSVRAFRRYAWIDDILEGEIDDTAATKVHFLKFTLKKSTSSSMEASSSPEVPKEINPATTSDDLVTTISSGVLCES